MATAHVLRGTETILPAPVLGSRMSLRTVLRKRRTTREISSSSLSIQMLSDLLWSAWGVNRKKGPFGLFGRTAASASNSQEIDLYLALEEGTYLYDAGPHRLRLIVEGDLRRDAMTPGQRSINCDAPVHLIYVVDLNRLVSSKGFQEPGLHDLEIQKSYYFVDTGLIAGNVYLFAASYGLAAWFHNCNKEALAKHLGLRADQRVLFAQSVGYPA